MDVNGHLAGLFLDQENLSRLEKPDYQTLICWFTSWKPAMQWDFPCTVISCCKATVSFKEILENARGRVNGVPRNPCGFLAVVIKHIGVSVQLGSWAQADWYRSWSFAQSVHVGPFHTKHQRYRNVTYFESGVAFSDIFRSRATGSGWIRIHASVLWDTHMHILATQFCIDICV